MVKIAVLASFNMDLVMRTERLPDAGETLQGEFAMHLGGKGFNHAVAASRLGADVAVAGRVGDDQFGRMFLDALDREGIDRRAVTIDHEIGTGVASIIVEGDGANAIVQAPRANRNTMSDDVTCHVPTLFDGVDVVMLQFETSPSAALQFAVSGRAAGAICILNAAPAAPLTDDLAASIDVIIANELEAAAMSGQPADSRATAISAAGALVGRGVAQVVITLGSEGAVAVHDGRSQHVPAIGVAVVDTVGAGDAFCAAFAVRTAEGANLDDALRFANAAGALACTKHGAEPSMPARAAVNALLTKGASQ